VDIVLKEKDQIVLSYFPGESSGFYAAHIVLEYDMDTYHVASQETPEGSYNQMWRGDFKSCLGWLRDWAIDLEHDFRYAQPVLTREQIQALDE
jgi:hypothetical protein